VTKIEQTFGQKKVLLPVIHVETEAQALQQCEVASKAGCKGVFLINHRIKNTKLIPIFDSIFLQFPKLWAGVNFLDLNAKQALLKVPTFCKGLWVDDAYIHEGVSTFDAMEMWANVMKYENLLYFGSVAFKYQKPVTDVKTVARHAAPFMDVVMTSGDATGSPAWIGKVVAMKEAIGNGHLGLASGVTSNNVKDYLPYVDVFLVSTGISKSFTELDLDSTKQLNDMVSSF
jgi:uncharacterized protein